MLESRMSDVVKGICKEKVPLGCMLPKLTSSFYFFLTFFEAYAVRAVNETGLQA